MQQEFIIKQDKPYLLLFFAGWGMDKHPFLEYKPTNHDLLICYDYRTLDFDYSLLNGYQRIDIVAWSMGVWVATQSIFPENITVGKKIAINGTPYPIDDAKGIPSAIYNGTLDGLNETTLKKFQRRMCTSGADYKYFQSVEPQRSVDELKIELADIQKFYESSQPASFEWDEVYIGTNDRIFPAQNQQLAWSNTHTKIHMGDEGHYDKELFTNVLDRLWIND